MAAAGVRELWNRLAGSWDDGYDWYARSVRPLATWIGDAVASPGARVLDIGCGTGQPALEIARRVGDRGRVMAVDLSPDMVAALSRRVKREGFDNVEVREMDAEDLQLPDSSFEAVSCLCGLMFSADPVQAVREVRRVLVPDGRFAVVVWDDLVRSPYFTVAREVLGAVIPSPPPDRQAPGAYRLSASGELERVLVAGGLSNVRVDAVEIVFEFDSAAEYWQRFTQFSGVGPKLAGLSSLDSARIEGLLQQGTAPYHQDGRLRLTASARAGIARRPDR